MLLYPMSVSVGVCVGLVDVGRLERKTVLLSLQSVIIEDNDQTICSSVLVVPRGLVGSPRWDIGVSENAFQN